jgi:predicted RNA binding protein YcfA (HicA-like mRNA interferase family)
LKIPKDIYGRDFADHLIRHWEFVQTRQNGSHILLRTERPSGMTVSVPAHKPMRPGTLRQLIVDIAEHKSVALEEILRKL